MFFGITLIRFGLAVPTFPVILSPVILSIQVSAEGFGVHPDRGELPCICIGAGGRLHFRYHIEGLVDVTFKDTSQKHSMVLLFFEGPEHESL